MINTIEIAILQAATLFNISLAIIAFLCQHLTDGYDFRGYRLDDAEVVGAWAIAAVAILLLAVFV